MKLGRERRLDRSFDLLVATCVLYILVWFDDEQVTVADSTQRLYATAPERDSNTAVD